MKKAGNKTSAIKVKLPSKHFRFPGRVNLQNICLLSAAVIGLKFWAHALNKKDKASFNAYKQARKQTGRDFAGWVVDLQRLVQLDLAAGAGVREVMELDRALGADFKLRVFTGRSEREIIYAGGPGKTSSAKTINILHENEHFTFISSPAAFLKHKYFCDVCGRAYNNRLHHGCSNAHCTNCKQRCTARFGQMTRHECTQCNMIYATDDCYRKHLQGVCNIRKLCNECGSVYWLNLEKDYTHKCGDAYCRTCKKYMPSDHLCYMLKSVRSRQAERREEFIMYTFADFECTAELEEETQPGLRRHTVNLVCSITVCPRCEENKQDENHYCGFCRGRSHSIDAILDQNTNVVKEFLAWADEKAAPVYGNGGEVVPEREHYITFFNMRSYDGLFIIRQALTDLDWIVCSHIIDGRKVLKLVLENKRSGRKLHFFDFCAYVHTSLASLCISFGLDPSLAKGDFPHR